MPEMQRERDNTKEKGEKISDTRFWIFTIALVMVASIFLGIITHELTHLIGTDPPQGICLGFCRGAHDPLILGMAYSPKFNQTFRDETIPLIASCIVIFGIFIFWVVKFKKILEKGE